MSKQIIWLSPIDGNVWKTSDKLCVNCHYAVHGDCHHNSAQVAQSRYPVYSSCLQNRIHYECFEKWGQEHCGLEGRFFVQNIENQVKDFSCRICKEKTNAN